MRCYLLTYGAIFAIALLLADAGTAVLPCDSCSEGTGTCVAEHGRLSCKCIGNWSGDDCSTNICDRENPCMNGGICSINPQDQSEYLCACPTRFAGPRCEYLAEGPRCDGNNMCGTNGTCYERASNGVSEETTMCVCDEDHWGERCSHSAPDPCASDAVNHCWGHGTCVYEEDDRLFAPNGFTCVCTEGYHLSSWCEYPPPPVLCNAISGPCDNGGECEAMPFNNNYTCTCPGGFTGQNCTVPFDPCAPNPCSNGGACNIIEAGHYYNCSCPNNYAGYDCESVADPCDGRECQSGSCVVNVLPDSNGLYDPSALDAASCDCDCGYTGDSCESVINPCDSAPCQNGGTCTRSNLLTSDYTCDCPPNFTGPNCETEDHCASSPCEGDNTVSCVNLPGGFYCECREGWGGQSCLADLDECWNNPCRNGGTCMNAVGSFSCVCLVGYTGTDCATSVMTPVACNASAGCENGGTCVPGSGGTADSCDCPQGFNGSRCEVEVCPLEYCEAAADNGECDLECFTPACGYDGGRGECFPPSSDNEDPWAKCPFAEECRLLFGNGRCDIQCNRAECLYDAHECIPPSLECPAGLKCQERVEDGRCDEDCNTDQCPFDSVDCNSQRFVRDFLEVIIIANSRMPFEGSWRQQFLEALASVLNSIPIVVDVQMLSRDEIEALGLRLDDNVIVYLVTLRLDIEYCQDQCPADAQDAANVLRARYSTGRATVGPYRVADAYSSDEGGGGTGFQAYFVVIPILVVLAVPLLAWLIITGVKRRRVRAKLWRPQSPTSESDQSQGSSPPTERRRGQQAGTLISSEAASISHSDSEDYIARGSKAAKMDPSSSAVRWSDLRVPVSEDPASSSAESSTAVIGQVGHDSRKWNCLHYDALRNPKLIQELVEKYRRHNGGKSVDVNAPGPGGYTPLMLAVTQRHSTGSYESFGLPCRSSSESSADVGELSALIATKSTSGKRLLNGVNGSTGLTGSSGSETTNPVAPTQNGITARVSPLESSVGALIASNVSLNTSNDFGQTALHLAAACSRGDYVKQLLDGGADPNLPDNWGQSPIHAAIGASAEGAFLILLNHPKLDINHKSDGGITPLMAAVKQSNQLMVKQLVKKNADITMTDNEGRTAVHWAAVINNLEALKLLIRQGPDTIKDQQDSKGQTPLFLACREGCASCVKHLLDCFANGTLLDHFDRSPMQIAYEKQHHDIIEMLKTSAHGPIYYPSHFHRSHAPTYQMGSRLEQQQAQLVQQALPRQYAYVGRPRHTSKASRERTIPELLMHDSGATQLSSSGMQLPVASMRLHPSSQRDYAVGELQGPPVGQTFGDLTEAVASASVYGAIPQYTSSIAQPTLTQTDMHPLPTTVGYATDLNGDVIQQKLEYPSAMGYGTAPVTTSLHQGVPTYGITSSSLQDPSMQLVATSTGCNELDSVIGSLSNIQPTASSCVASSVTQNLPSHTVLSTSTYADSAISLSDIEPSVVNELITSMSEDPTTLPQPTFNSHAPPSMAVTSQSLDDLPLVGYTVPATTGIDTVTQAGDYGYAPASSTYCQTAYGSSAALQATSTYPGTHAHTHQHQQPPPPPSSGSTRRLQHYPLEQAPVPYVHQNGFSPPQPTSAGSNSSKSPVSSYYPSPPNSNELQHSVTTGHHADPPSLTPSPESRDHGQFTTESLVERVIPPHDFTIHHAQPYNCIAPSLTRMESYV